MKIKSLFLSLLLLFAAAPPVAAQFYGIKSNVLLLACGTLNAGFEASLSDRYTLDVSAYWNPVRARSLQMQVLAIQPGVRRWLYEAYAGHFIGTHLTAARYNIGGRRHHTSGWLAGMGFSYGHSWLLSRRWNLTLEAGIGLFYADDRRRRHDVP